MDQEILKLLSEIPDHVDYACDAEELDLEDIPEDRISKVRQLLNHSDSYVVFKAAKLLTHWGQNEGFDALAYLLNNDQLDGWITHRLHGYDDTLQHVLSAFVSYWAIQSDLGCCQYARTKIFPCVVKIIEASNTQPFDINSIFWIIERKHYNEYIPLLKNHLTQIIDDPKLHFGKIHDAIELMLEPDFVHDLLINKGKTLKDFKVKNS